MPFAMRRAWSVAARKLRAARKRRGSGARRARRLCNDRHATFSDMPAALAVGVRVLAGDGLLGQRRTLVDDALAEPGIAPDLDVIQQNRVLDFAIAVDPHSRRQHAAVNPA